MRAPVAAVDRVIRMAESGPLSKSLPAALKLANVARDNEFASWLKLELLGYLHGTPELTDSVVVPEYRAVGGQWLDEFGRVLVINDSKLAFFNEERLRQGVTELEGIAEASGPLLIQPIDAMEIIREALHVNVIYFRFSPHSVKQVLSNIRADLLERLAKYQTEHKTLPETERVSGPEILELKPNFYGLGVNLKALWWHLRKRR